MIKESTAKAWLRAGLLVALATASSSARGEAGDRDRYARAASGATAAIERGDPASPSAAATPEALRAPSPCANGSREAQERAARRSREDQEWLNSIWTSP